VTTGTGIRGITHRTLLLRELRANGSSRCSICKAIKPLSEFNSASANSYSITPRCRLCNQAKDRELYAINREKRIAKSAHWNRNNRARRAANERDRRKNVAHKMHGRISAQIRDALRGEKGQRKSFELLGYTLEDLRRHLERQFTKGMSWSNMDEWHIDHIVPKSSFKITGPDDPELKRCWSLSNLRPLWAEENLRKRDSRTHLL
jgi:hypothetical protein